MPPQSDNAVIIDACVNVAEFEKSFERMERAAEGFAGKAQKQLDKVDGSLDKAAKNAKKFKIEPTTDGIEAAGRKLDNLNATIENQTKQLAQYRLSYERVCERFGAASNEALKLERKILQLEAAVDKNTKGSDEYAAALRDAERVMQTTAGAAGKMKKGTDEAGDSMEHSSKSTGVFDSALGNLVANGISAMISAMGNLLVQTKEYRRDLSFLEQNARDAGVSMEYLHKQSAKLYAVTGDNNEVVEALSNILATDFSEKGMAQAIDLLAGAVIKFPETMKIESLADSLQETIAAGEATGQFSELLSRLGVDVDKFNAKMARTSSESGRQKLALDTLRKEGLDQIWISYQQNNEQLMENAAANYNLQRTYADLSSQIEPIETMLRVTLAEALLNNKDSIGKIIAALGDFIEIGAKVFGALSELNPVLLLVGGALALIVVKAAGVALGANIMAGGVAAATKTLAVAGPAAATAGAQFLLLSTNILMVAAAVWLVTSGIAALINAIKGVPQNMTINTPTMPDINQMKGKMGYASGTRSAMPGWHWVGENGPELRSFSGGEQVLTAAQSQAAFSGRTSAAYSNTAYHDNRSFTFLVDSVGTLMRIEARFKNEKMQMRQGAVR